MQRPIPERAVANDTLRLFAIHNFPGLPDVDSDRQFLPELRLEPAAAPDPFDEDGFKGKGTDDCWLHNDGSKRSTSNVQRPMLNLEEVLSFKC